MTARAIVRITDDTTRAEIAEAITNMAHRASREFPVVGTPEQPTPWDLRHGAINALIDDYWEAPA